MKANEMRDMASEALNDELVKLRREQFNLRMQRATGQAAQPHEFGRVRKDIARIKTILNEKRAAQAAEGSAK